MSWAIEQAFNKGDLITATEMVANSLRYLTFSERTKMIKYFRGVCSRGSLDYIQWLLNQCPTIISIDDEAFVSACKGGHLDIVKFFLLNLDPTINITDEDYEDAFCEACRNGHRDVAEYLLTIQTSIDISTTSEYPFREACLKGHLDVAKWLLTVKPSIDVSALNDYSFRAASGRGHLDIAKWLLTVKPSIDISADNEEAFRTACRNGYLEVAQWLVSIKPTINVNANNDAAFRSAYEELQWHVVEWMLDELNATIGIETCDQAFRIAVRNSIYLLTAELLYYKNPFRYRFHYPDVGRSHIESDHLTCELCKQEDIDAVAHLHPLSIPSEIIDRHVLRFM